MTQLTRRTFIKGGLLASIGLVLSDAQMYISTGIEQIFCQSYLEQGPK